MQVPKPTDADKARFRSALANAQDVTIRPMFGNLGAFVHGNMFAALLGDAIGVRLITEVSRQELSGLAGAGPFGPEGRPMAEYVALPAEWSTEPRRISEWVERAWAEVAELPPKVAKPKSAEPDVGESAPTT